MSNPAASVDLPDCQKPITPEQYDQMLINDKVAKALVCRADTLDLEAIAVLLHYWTPDAES